MFPVIFPTLVIFFKPFRFFLNLMDSFVMFVTGNDFNAPSVSDHYQVRKTVIKIQAPISDD